MSKILEEISATQVDQETHNGGGNAAYCAYLSAMAIIEAGLCAAGAASSCAAHRSYITLISQNCKP